MMSFRQWMALLVVYTVYMLVGAVIFLYLEAPKELQGVEALLQIKQEILELVQGMENGTRGEVEGVLGLVGGACDQDFLGPPQPPTLEWTYWNSFFFTFTVITTIGFGHMSPDTAWGKVFCILYATIGVPLNGILVASLADIFSSKVVNSRIRASAKRYESWVKVATDAVLYLIPGLIVFLVVPSAILLFIEEGWDYLDSFYYAFITLTTIGFGDYVAGFQHIDYDSFMVYKVFHMVWIIFGLGYLVMLVTFIQKALKSKKIHQIEKKLARAIKTKTTKINSNLHRDLKRLRAVANTVKRARGELEGVQGPMGSQGSLDVCQVEGRLAVTQPPTRSTSPIPPGPKRAFSEKDIKDKDDLDCLSSLQDVDTLLDVVETLLREHEAEVEIRAEQEAHSLAHHTLQTLQSTISDASDDTTTSDLPIDQDTEAGYYNSAYECDHNELPYNTNKLSGDITELGKTQFVPGGNDQIPRDENDKLQKQLNAFLAGRSRSQSDSTEVRTAGELLDMMENACKPWSSPDVTDAGVGHSTVPARLKPDTSVRPTARSVFMDSQGNLKQHPEKQSAARRWSIDHLDLAQGSTMPRPKRIRPSVSHALLRISHWLHLDTRRGHEDTSEAQDNKGSSTDQPHYTHMQE